MRATNLTVSLSHKNQKYFEQDLCYIGITLTLTVLFGSMVSR